MSVTKILVIGLDAVEYTLMQDLMRTGRAPNLAALAESGRFTQLDSPCMDTLPGAIWPDIHTGRPARVHGEYFHPQQIRTGEPAPRELQREELDVDHYFWTVAGRAGKRFVVVDPIQAAPATDLDDPQVLEWCIHDQHWGSMTVPESLADIGGIAIVIDNGTFEVHKSIFTPARGKIWTASQNRS